MFNTIMPQAIGMGMGGMGMGTGMGPGMGPGGGYYYQGQGYMNNPQSIGQQHLSSPFEADPDVGVHEFCEAYGIGMEEEQCLEKLGFQMGDKLDDVVDQEWKEAGFKPLAWKRVLKAYKKCKDDRQRV
jgi:hypothetical protein